VLASFFQPIPDIWTRMSGLTRFAAAHDEQMRVSSLGPLPGSTPSSAATPPSVDALRFQGTPWVFQANRFFLSQSPGTYNPQASLHNTNCGPTSLAMALLALGLHPPGLPQGATAEAWIDMARYAMRGDMNDFELTSDDDVLRGAIQSGARAWKIDSVDTLDGALASGALVALAGNPAAYAHRFDASSLKGFDGGHFILVAGKSGDRYVINDPLSRVGSLVVTREELARYMAYKNWNSGIAISR
jgi:hypothetical protein